MMYLCKKNKREKNRRLNNMTIHTCAEMTEYVDKVGFLPLLPIGVAGWSADELVDPDCRYMIMPDGSWEWALWRWKGEIIRESGCAYGKFFSKKAAFVSKKWWPDFCNYRRSRFPYPEENSIEYIILQTLREGGNMISRDLRRACGFTGTKMRGKFDSFVSQLQMGCYIVTQDFVYPHDRHGKEYGWGFSLLTTPEDLFGPQTCHIDRTPEESLQRIRSHFHEILPDLNDKSFSRLMK